MSIKQDRDWIEIMSLRGRVRELRAALREILDEVTGDRCWHIVATAARDALKGEK